MNKLVISKRKKNEISHFSNLERIWWGALSPAGQKRYDKRFELFKDLCRPQKNDEILEIGAGDGEFTKRLSTLSSQIVATDITPAVVKRGRRYFQSTHKNNVRFSVEDAESLSYKKGTMDIVCGVSILHHIDYKQALKEAYRVLKPGGVIFFSEPNLINPVIYLGLHIKFLRKRMEFSTNETALLKWKVTKILKTLGYSKYQVNNYDFLYPHTPTKLITMVNGLSNILEKTPLIRDISGSLIIWAKK